MEAKIAVLPGDGIGPEVMECATAVLEHVQTKFNFRLQRTEAKIGGAAYEEFGTHFPKETLDICKDSDAILFGSVGGPVSEADLPKWKGCEAASLLPLRKEFNLSTNIRLATITPELSKISPLQDDIARSGVDIAIYRELIGDIYFGEHKQYEEGGIRKALDVAEYDENQIINITKSAFEYARRSGKKVTSVDKANVLATSRLWREIVSEFHQKEYSDVELEHMLVDNCAMQLAINPAQFDIILTANLFGDILSDLASALIGSLGLMPSASLNGENKLGVYEPAGGSAPEIAGKNIANPIAQILSAALMLRYSFDLEDAAIAIESACKQTLKEGFKTGDLCLHGEESVGTKEITDKIIERI